MNDMGAVLSLDFSYKVCDQNKLCSSQCKNFVSSINCVQCPKQWGDFKLLYEEFN